MIKAPERIWAVPERNCTVYMSGNSPITAQDGPFTHHRHGAASEYIRTDMLDAKDAEIDRLREALTCIVESADPYTTGDGHARCAEIARAALSGEGET